jgi:23S rRNA (adenine-N6)-dimethyltransferase
MFRKRRRPQLSQNFFHNRQLVRQIVRKTSFGKKDTVIEIGPGKGIVTQELLKIVRAVIAVEIDGKLCRYLIKKFSNHPDVVIFKNDFLRFPLPTSEYKVITNTPFSIEGKIIRKLLDGSNPPQETHLVVRRDVGERWVGYKKESYFSIVHKPWFDMTITHRFKRTDFRPVPNVDSVLISIFKRETPLLKEFERKDYIQFVKQGFGGGRRLNTNLQPLLPASQLKRLSKKYNFSYRTKPTDLALNQWIQLFRSWK